MLRELFGKMKSERRMREREKFYDKMAHRGRVEERFAEADRHERGGEDEPR